MGQTTRTAENQAGTARSRHAWHPSSWKELPALQQPDWPDKLALERATGRLASLPALVKSAEVHQLRTELARVADGNAFLLQAGDCSESFDEFSARAVRDKLKVILQMAVALTYAAGLPVVKVGRIAGQFAKPRTSETENVNGTTLPSFRGHMVNCDLPDQASRVPDPERLTTAYNQSSATLALIGAFSKGGFADLSHVHSWNLEFVASSKEGKRYNRIANEIDQALRFISACGVELNAEEELHRVNFYTSHEALILPYEEALTRVDPFSGSWYDSSAHMLWVGERTRQPEGAHVEFLSGITNPIGVKIGPATSPDQLIALCSRLDPERTPGHLTLITRIGHSKVRELLPPLLEAVREEGFPVVWACDPMHANTITSTSGRKTRKFDDILAEIRGFFKAHQEVGTRPGGVHIELTGDNVTECIGGLDDLAEDQLHLRYTTTCDPRLNARQSIELAFQVSELLRS
ncbi:MAG: 3-deoxy-7-phosphoheptulonate synthase class II [Actinobacteria bacterium]|nr:3-deoxy-7-phosphoheptulonate synthase class II [Actinomycetota bacterium]MCL5446814.1 3-deoxy-7-phosphoheptulonate synthase class II [Actinomycetota bacterium]